MTEPDHLSARMEEARAALANFAAGPAQEAADALAQAFESAGQRIGAALGAAVFDGEAGFKRLAKVALEELAKIALAQLQLPTSPGGGASFFGARAAGGAVNRGGAYLVGENGPELFIPSGSGRIAPAGAAGAVSVHFHLSEGAGAESLRRHHGQIAAAVARAAAYGRRNL